MSGVLAAMVSGAAGVINGALQDATNEFSASIEFQNDGDYLYGDGAGGAATEDWVTPSETGVAALYELQVNVTSGSIDIGTVDTWLALSSGRTYAKNAAGTAVLRVRIREAGSGTVRTDQVVQIIVS